MNCQECNDRFPDYLENELDDLERARFDSHLESCPQCREALESRQKTWNALATLPAPSPELGKRFHAALDAYRKGQEEGQALWEAERQASPILTFFRSSYGIAAAVAVSFVLGALLTLLIRTQEVDTGRITHIEEQLTSLKELTALSLLAQTSPTERLKATAALTSLETESPETYTALIHHIESDPSVNVRYAALKALEAHADDSYVRQRLVELLAVQDSPLIRAELIKILVRLKERSALPLLHRISIDPEENQTVSELAIWSLQVLETLEDERV